MHQEGTSKRSRGRQFDGKYTPSAGGKCAYASAERVHRTSAETYTKGKLSFRRKHVVERDLEQQRERTRHATTTVHTLHRDTAKRVSRSVFRSVALDIRDVHSELRRQSRSESVLRVSFNRGSDVKNSPGGRNKSPLSRSAELSLRVNAATLLPAVAPTRRLNGNINTSIIYRDELIAGL